MTKTVDALQTNPEFTKLISTVSEGFLSDIVSYLSFPRHYIAEVLAKCRQAAPVVFVSFNRKEDNLLGSRQFVEEGIEECGLAIGVAHVLEMVGYCTHEPGSQRIPSGLPITGPDVGDFLGLIANRRSNRLVKPLLRAARGYCAGLHVLGLQVYLGLESSLPHLLRSDHGPFWHAKLPAVMWTDTSELRNANHHHPTDALDTLDYTFMRQVAQLLMVAILSYGAEGSDRNF